MRTAGIRCQAMSSQVQHAQRRHIISNTYPEPETEKERSSVDFPQVLPGVAQGAVLLHHQLHMLLRCALATVQCL